MTKLFEWKCPECGKVIHSTYKKQFTYNKEQHILAHKREKENETPKADD